MADINNIISQSAIKGIKTTINLFNTLTGKLKVLDNSIKTTELSKFFGDALKGAKALDDSLKKIDVTQSDSAKTAKELAQAEKLMAQNAILNAKAKQEEEKAIALAEKANQAAIRTINQANKANAQRVKLTREEARELKAKQVLENKEAGFLAKLKASNELLRLEREKLKDTDEGYLDRIKEINENINKNNDLLKENADATEKNKMSVGSYEESINKVIESQGLFSDSLGGTLSNFINLSQQEGGLKSMFASAIKGFAGMTKAAMAFVLTPVGAVIAAIVAAFALFRGALSRNQTLADKYNQTMAGLKNVLDLVVGKVFELVAGITQLGLGLSKLSLSGIKKGVEDLSNTFSDLKGSMAEAYEAGVRIEMLRQDLRKLNIELTVSLSQNRAIAEQQQAIADDATRSFKEREIAANNARKANEAAARDEARLANESLRIIQEEIKQAKIQGSLTDDLRQKEADAMAEANMANSNLLRSVIENEKVRRELVQDRLERDLDILIDGFDNIKMINEKIITDDTKTFINRADLLNQTVELADKSFAKQIEIIKKFSKVQFDENELLATQDAQLLAEKIRSLETSEIIEGRILEIIRERRTALADFAELEKQLSKERLEISKALNDEILMLEKELAEEEKAIQIETENEITSNLIAQEQAKLSQLERSGEERIQIQRNLLAAGLISATEFSQREEQIKVETSQRILAEEINNLNILLNAVETTEAEKILIREEIADKELEIDELITEGKLANLERIKNAQQELQNYLINSAVTLLDAQANFLQIDLENLESQKQQQLAIAGDDADRRLRIEENFAKKELEIKRKQDRNEKASALFNVAINTAAAITKTTANLGLPLALPFIAAATILGGIQAAAIAARPLPEYYKGTENSEGGLAVVGERGTELGITPKGQMFLTPNSASLMNLEKGTIIKNAKETSTFLNSPLPYLESTINNGSNNISNILHNNKDIMTILNNNTTQNKSSKSNDSLLLSLLIENNKKHNKELIKALKGKQKRSNGTIITPNGLTKNRAKYNSDNGFRLN